MRRVRLVAALTLFLTLMGFGRQAFAVADPPAPRFTMSVDRTTVAPGQAANVTVTFTNRESGPVNFLYATVTPDFFVPAGSGVAPYAFTGCTAASWCGPNQFGFSYNLTAPQAPVAPGESRTVTVSFRFAPDADCAWVTKVGFYLSYVYYEYDQGIHDSLPPIAGTSSLVTLVCPAVP
ncbi:hypothetical protein ACIPYS_26610 [Kitasatospora sp. NPDC089913]|uniref:hypothetical protein n=1 Tax=Kitasatospora sp. NPDC089913 TaxID=3364080 RepID=UPI00380C207A